MRIQRLGKQLLIPLLAVEIAVMGIGLSSQAQPKKPDHRPPRPCEPGQKPPGCRPPPICERGKRPLGCRLKPRRPTLYPPARCKPGQKPPGCRPKPYPPDADKK